MRHHNTHTPIYIYVCVCVCVWCVCVYVCMYIGVCISAGLNTYKLEETVLRRYVRGNASGLA